jgi:hypothetical protein
LRPGSVLAEVHLLAAVAPDDDENKNPVKATSASKRGRDLRISRTYRRHVDSAIAIAS